MDREFAEVVYRALIMMIRAQLMVTRYLERRYQLGGRRAPLAELESQLPAEAGAD